MRSTEVSGMLSNPGAVYQAKVVARGIRKGGENGKGGECGVEGGIALWRIHHAVIHSAKRSNNSTLLWASDSAIATFNMMWLMWSLAQLTALACYLVTKRGCAEKALFLACVLIVAQKNIALLWFCQECIVKWQIAVFCQSGSIQNVTGLQPGSLIASSPGEKPHRIPSQRGLAPHQEEGIHRCFHRGWTFQLCSSSVLSKHEGKGNFSCLTLLWD